MLSRIKAHSEKKDTHVQRKCAIWRIALYKCILRTTIISQRRPFFKIFFLEIVACPIIWAQQLCKLTTTNWKWTEIFCQLRKRYYQKKILLFQWYKKQHEKEIAAWRLGCSTILMLLEILWVFDKYLPQPCFPEWHENREIIQRDVKNIFPSIKSNSLFSLLSLPLEILWVFDKYLLPEKRNDTKTENHTELSNVYFSQNPKYDAFKFLNWTFICLLTMFIAKPGFFCNKNHSSLQFF